MLISRRGRDEHKGQAGPPSGEAPAQGSSVKKSRGSAFEVTGRGCCRGLSPHRERRCRSWPRQRPNPSAPRQRQVASLGVAAKKGNRKPPRLRRNARDQPRPRQTDQAPSKRPRHQNKELEAILVDAERQGWRVVRANKFKMYCPCPEKHMATIALTPSGSNYAVNRRNALDRDTCWVEE